MTVTSPTVKLVLASLSINSMVVLWPTAKLDWLLVIITVGARLALTLVLLLLLLLLLLALLPVLAVSVLVAGLLLTVGLVLVAVPMRMDTVLLVSCPSWFITPEALEKRWLSTKTAALLAPEDGVNVAL